MIDSMITKKGRMTAVGRQQMVDAERTERSAAEIEAERAVIRRVQEGDHAAFETLVKAYEKKVFWIAFNLVNNVDDAQEVAQESFLNVFRAIKRFDFRFNFYTWLYRIVVNLAIDRLRKKGKQNNVSIEDFPTDPATNDDPEMALRRTEIGKKINEVLNSMPDKYRTIIVLRDLNELSCEEIGEIIGCTNATTRWRLHKAREMFREKWDRLEV